MGRSAHVARLPVELVGALAVLGIGAPACAAAANVHAPVAAGPNEVETVVVTARRIEENIQDVPGAVTAVTARPLEEIKPRTLQDLQGLAPNVSIGVVGAGPGAAAIYIRGLGYQDVEKGQNPAVGLLIDDVVIGSNTAQLIDAFDLQQVEIDRGPQGIFYGKNTTAGAISIHRTRPTHVWGLTSSFALGDYGQVIGRGILNTPLGEEAGLKLGLSYRQRDGFLDNIYTHDNRYGRDRMVVGNLELDWRPRDGLDLLGSADFAHQYGEGTPNTLGNPLAARVYGPIYGLLPFGEPQLGAVAFNGDGSPYVPGVTAPLGPRQAAADFPERNLLTQQRYSLNATWDTALGQFVSITAFIHQHDDGELDLDGSCGISAVQGGTCKVLPNPLLGFLHVSRLQRYEQFTEEARFTHDFGDRAKLLAGVYYFRHDLSALQHNRTAAPGVPASASLIDQTSGEVNQSVSVFGNLDVNITSRLRVSGGVRYLSESTDFHNAFTLTYLPFTGPASIPLIAFQQSKSWRKAITRFAVDYKLSADNLIYASRSEGFRSGGFAPRSTLSESQPGQTNYSLGANYSSYEPETTTAYEIGSKNTFLEGQLTVNAAAFLTQVEGHQQSLVVITPGYGPGTSTYIGNLPKVEIRGIELEVVARPRAIRGLTLSVSGGYQDARVTDGRLPGVKAPVNPDGTAGAPGTVYDLTGTPLERAPKLSATVQAGYGFDLGQGRADLNVSYKWTDKFVFATIGPIGDEQPAYGLVDLSASYAWREYKLTLAAKNLGDTLYRTNSLPAVFFQGWGEPRTFLLELQSRW